jgi:hypothetical protein
MATAKPQDDLTLLSVAERLLPNIITRSIEEAEQLDSVGVEVALMRTWLYETLREKEKPNSELLRRLLNDVVRAVSLKYRLGPKSTDQLRRSMKLLAEQLNAESGPPPAEDEPWKE